MSNYLAIATVTATLRDLLQEAVTDIIPGVDVEISTERPNRNILDNSARINIYLYQVLDNTALRNMDLPTRGGGGRLVQRPQVALDLYYLLSFYGDENESVPQRLLGRAVSALHTEPILTSQRIGDTISSIQYLADSDLAEQIERVKVTPLSLNLEEVSKLWSLLVHNARYALSATYRASVVLIEEEITPSQALPVQKAKLHVMPFRQPVIESVSPPIITAGCHITIKGQNLKADKVKVTFGGLEGTINEVSDKQIKVTLPDGLRAGVNSVQVVHELDFGTDSEPHQGFESNVAAFVLRPTITAPSADSAKVTLTFNPKVSKTQRVVLLLNNVATPTTAYSFKAPKDNGITDDGVEETDTIDFTITNVVAGTYLVRVQVDGAESLLERDSDGKYNEPTVTIS